jgi:Ca2+-binding RTX toxin-like protein
VEDRPDHAVPGKVNDITVALAGSGGNDVLDLVDGVSGNDTADGSSGSDVCVTDDGDITLACEA